MEALSRREEEEVMETAKKQALKACDDLVKSRSPPRSRIDKLAFADCATGRTFSLPFACRPHLQAMQGCMKD